MVNVGKYTIHGPYGILSKFPGRRLHIGVSKNRGKTPKMKIMENPIQMDDLGGKPTIFGNTHVGVNTLACLPLPGFQW